MTVLVLGGAGYIGSHMVDRLVDQQTDVAVVDNLVKGHRAAVRPEARFYEGDVRDKEFMRSVFKKRKHRCSGPLCGLFYRTGKYGEATGLL